MNRAPECLHTRFEAQTAAASHARALTFAGESLSYGELNARANRLARYLGTIGVARGTRVGLCLDRNLDPVVAILAVLKAGAAYVPMDPIYPADRVRMIVEDAACPVVLAHLGQQARFEGGEARVVVLDGPDRPWDGEPDHNLDLDCDPSDLAYVIYTSGSTGRPKGALVTHHNVYRLFTAMQPDFGFGPDDVWTLFHSYAFDFSVSEIWGALFFGGRIVMVPHLVSRSPEAFHQLLIDEGVTVLNQTPSAFKQLLDVDESLPWETSRQLKLRYVLVGGEYMALWSLAPWYQRHGEDPCRIVHVYGITETTVFVTYRFLTQADTAHGTPSFIGEAISDLYVHVLDENRQPVAIGEVGELYVGGPGVCLGYLNRPELTAERFVPDPLDTTGSPAILYKSGDLVRLFDGDLEFIGRNDSQVQLRGFRIELGEVEARLNEVPGVRSGIVRLREDTPGDQRLVAWYLAKSSLPVEALREHLLRTLPPYMVPSGFVHLDAFPLNNNGKIDNGALPAPVYTSANYVEPGEGLESALAEIWQSVLRAERVGAHDNFFALGGHSLLATRILLRIDAQFGKVLPLRALYDAPTVAALAGVLAEAKERGADLPISPLPHADRTLPLPLSASQEQLWILHQLQPALCAYNIPLRFTVEGKVPRETLERALNLVIERHEALRTVFPARDGHPEARILPALAVPIAPCDLSGLSDAEQAEAVESGLRALAGEVMDLAEGPLIRATLYQLGPERQVLGMVIHHGIFDGWSISVLLGELADACRALNTETVWPPAPLAWQFVDFAAWQRACLASGACERELDYWKDQLAGPLPVLELPLDFPRPASLTWAGARVRLRLAPDVVAGVEGLARRMSVPPFAVLLAGWRALLYRYAGQDDLVIGAGLANRNDAAWEPLIGFFVNSVALRCRVGRDLPFERLVSRVHDVVLGAQEHQTVPFERVVASVQTDRDPARSPIFQTMIVLHNTPTYRTERPGLVMTAEEMDNGAAKFELTLSIQPSGGALELDLEYNTALFKRETAALMLDRFEALLAGATAAPETAIGRLNLATAAREEGAPRAVETNQKAVESVVPCLHQVFEAQAARIPNAPAVSCEGTTLSYDALNGRANRLAHHLRDLGVGPEVLVGLCLERSIDIVVAILAVLKAGGAYVPMDPVYPADRMRMIVDDAECPLVLTHATHAGRFAGGQARIIVLDGIETPWEGCPATNPETTSDAAGLAYVIYTSGSTGRPKGALLTHANVNAFVRGMEKWFQFQADEVWTLFHSYAFDFSVWEIWGALFHGGRIAVVPLLVSRSPREFHQLLVEEGVTVLNQTPSAFKQLQLHDETLPMDVSRRLRLRHVVLGGETVDIPGLAPWYARHADDAPRIYVGYGITETTVLLTVRPLHAHEAVPGTPNYIGTAIPGVRLEVRDTEGNPVGLGGTGELYVGGPFVARGYLRRPELTAERFVPDPQAPPGEPGLLYKSGDLVRVVENDFEFLGRNDAQVQLRGFRVELGEIESTLNRLEGIRTSVVRMREDVPGDQRLVAHYVAREPLSVDQIREHLLKTLPEYMVPSAFVHLERFPLNNSGKVDVSALPAPDYGTAGGSAGDAPQSETERSIAALWQELLRIPTAGRRDNFFASGGHSLLAIQLLARINQTLGADVPLGAFFENPTIAGLAERIDDGGQSRLDGWRRRLFEIKPGTGVPFFCVKGAGDVGGSYETFANALDDGQSFFGFPDLEFEGEGPATVERLAAQCIADMKQVRPDGPYYVGGYSFGGIVAYEMARQLSEAGEDVPLVAMIDSAVMEHHQVKRGLTWDYLHFNIQRVRVRLAILRLTWKLFLGYGRDGALLALRRLTKGPNPNPAAPVLMDYLRWIQLDSSVQYYLIQAGLATPCVKDRRLQMLEDQFVRNSSKNMAAGRQAMGDYTTRPADVRVTLFRAQHNPWRSEMRDPTFGWGRYAKKGVKIVEVPGNHMVIIRHPYATGLGRALQREIDLIEGRIEE